MNYKIINDEPELRRFLDLLPELKENESFYLTLFCRKKYCDIVKTSRNSLNEFVCKKEKIIHKIKTTEVALGTYTRDGDDKSEPIPESALVLYITPNPRDLFKASLDLIGDLAKGIADRNIARNPAKRAMSIVHKTRGTRHFTCFDVDSKEDGKLERIRELINPDYRTIVETRGGYHVMVKCEFFGTEEGKNRNWHNAMREISDINGDMLIAVPGTCHGGFVPRIVT